MPAQVPVTLLRHSVKCKSPLSLTANHCPQPLPLSPSMESQGMSCGRATTVSDLGCFWGSVWGSTKSGRCHSAQLLAGTRLPLCPIVGSFIQPWLPQIQRCSVTRSICSVWAGVFSQAVVGKLEDHTFLSPASKASQLARAWNLSSSLPFSVVLQPNKRACLSHVEPRTGAPNLHFGLLTP